MEIEFAEEGGYAEVWCNTDADTRLSVFREGGKIRIEMDAGHRHGDIGLGVGLEADEAQRVADYLSAQATVIREDKDDVGDVEDEEE